jgi:KDEL-tailed cysteine endopeptidase
MSKSVLVVVVAVIVVCQLGMQCWSMEIEDQDLASEESMWDLYERWQSYHSVSRQHEEKHRRFNFFKDNARHVHRVNKMGKPYKLKLNEYADMSNPEFKELYGARYTELRMSRPRPTTDFMHARATNLPSSVDWRTLGAVTPVKNQGSCGSCWAFATVATIEGINQIKTKQLVSLSEQELVDCDSGDEGCDGGLFEHAYDFVKKNGGLTTETFYPYLAKKQTCNINKEKSHSAIIDGYETVPANDEEALKKAVAAQPVAVAIDASGSDLQFYSEGVFTGDCGKELNHAVTVVGYGENPNGSKYWIVKNSWGTRWGEAGYIKMERGLSGDAQGKCGIAMDASYPVKQSNVTTTTTKRLPRRIIS